MFFSSTQMESVLHFKYWVQYFMLFNLFIYDEEDGMESMLIQAPIQNDIAVNSGHFITRKIRRGHNKFAKNEEGCVVRALLLQMAA